TGGAIGGAAKSAAIGIGKGVDAVRARRAARAGTEADRALLAEYDAAVPPELRTADERAAANVVERAAEDAEASPFEPGPAGDDAHQSKLAAMLDAAASRGRLPEPAALPKRVTRAELLAGTADPASLRRPAREQIKARIRRAESNGDDAADNPKSSAFGRYQFTAGTWRSYYIRRYGRGGLSDQAIAAKRRDPALNEVLMNDLLADNARALDAAGQPETAGSLYLLHFAGEAGGLAVLRAAPDTPVERILGAEVIRANPFLAGMSAADLLRWADRKMGGAATAARQGADPAPDGAAPEAEDIDLTFEPVPAGFDARPDLLDEDGRPNLRAELFGTPEEHAYAQLAAWRERDAADGLASADGDELLGRSVRVKERGPRRRSGPVHVMQAIADAGGIVDNEGHDLVKGRGIPKFMLGAGAIIRPEGTPGTRPLDAIGEYLWERGYFGPPSTADRPTTADVLELIERAAHEKMFVPEEALDARLAAERARQPGEQDVWDEIVEEMRRYFGDDFEPLDDIEVRDLALQLRGGGEDLTSAYMMAVERTAGLRAAEARMLTEDEDYDIPGFDDRPGHPAPPDWSDGESGGRSAAAARSEGEGGDLAAAAESDPAGAGAAFEPVGPEAKAQADSLKHDALMDAAAGDAGAYRIDEDGDPADLKALLDEIEEAKKAAAEMRKCMAPPKGGGE
ncbi:MAG TPA: hypothetical protein VGW34_14935, partial [Allosphingosinicella sp.]|nr:hypothetical protein [Allosphingosinicella sp.]